MQTDSEISRILKTLTVGQTVTIKYVVRGNRFDARRPFERWLDVTVTRIDGDVIYGSAYSAHYGTSDVHIDLSAKNMIRVNYDGWHVITNAESPFVK